MSDYTTEGFIKTVKIAGSAVTFTIEPSEPYVFESRAANESAATRKILLVADSDAQAKIVGADAEFSMGDENTVKVNSDENATKADSDKNTTKVDYTALLIAKANRMKVRLGIVGKEDEWAIPLPIFVNRIEVL